MTVPELQEFLTTCCPALPDPDIGYPLGDDGFAFGWIAQTGDVLAVYSISQITPLLFYVRNGRTAPFTGCR
jgi:hypothetical protein